MALAGQQLSENSISPDDCDSDALSTAAARGDIATVNQLLRAGVSANQQNSYGCTPLQVMKSCCSDIADQLLRAGADPNVRHFDTLVTPAHDVARAGFMDTLKCLLRHGADISLTDRWGNNPAHVAAKHGHYEMVRFLSQGLVLSQCKNQHGLTPLDYVKTSNVSNRTLEWMLRVKQEPTSLKTLSCMAIRRALGPKRLGRYRSLPLAGSLKRCLVLHDRRKN